MYYRDLILFTSTCGTSGHGLGVDLAVLGLQLTSMILKVISNLNDSDSLFLFLSVFIAVMKSKRMKFTLELCAFLTVAVTTGRVSLMKKGLLGKEGPPQEREAFPRGIEKIVEDRRSF